MGGRQRPEWLVAQAHGFFKPQCERMALALCRPSGPLCSFSLSWNTPSQEMGEAAAGCSARLPKGVGHGA